MVDTYGINYTNGNQDTFTVTNGRDGTGAVTDVRVNNQSVLVGNVANLTVDNALNKNSSNPVENSVVAQAIEDITLAKNPNLNIIGSNLIIDSGNVSGFSSSDYMQFPFIFNFNNYHWTLEKGFTTKTDITTQQNILDSKFGIALAIIGGQFVLAISSNGTSWDIGNVTGTYSVQPNTSYSVKLSWDGASYMLSYSLDETNYTTDITIASTLVHNATQEYVGGEADIWSGSYFPFGGTINLNNWKLTVNGLDVWLGMDDVGLGSRANIDLSNLTETGQHMVDTVKDQNDGSRIKTWTGTKTQYDAIVTKDTNTIYNITDDTTSLDVANLSLSNINNTGYIKMAGAGMPSDKYIDLTLGASGTQYTAPANGWVWNTCSSSNNNGVTALINMTKGYSVSIRGSAGAALAKLLPVAKGDIFEFFYDGAATNYGFRFYYAQGSESEAS